MAGRVGRGEGSEARAGGAAARTARRSTEARCTRQRTHGAPATPAGSLQAAHLRCRPRFPRTGGGQRARRRGPRCQVQSPAHPRPAPACVGAGGARGGRAWRVRSAGPRQAWTELRGGPPRRRRQPCAQPARGLHAAAGPMGRTCWRSHMRQSTTWQRLQCSAKASRSSGAGLNLTLRHACIACVWAQQMRKQQRWARRCCWAIRDQAAASGRTSGSTAAAGHTRAPARSPPRRTRGVR